MHLRARRSLFVLLPLCVLPVFAVAQAAKPAADPRIAQLLTSLSQVRGVSETALSPDGKQIAWVVAAEHGGTDIEAAAVTKPDAPRRLTACTSGAAGTENHIAWAPDGSQLAFFSDCGADHKTEIYLAKPKGGTARKLTALNGYAKSLSWAPDGKHLGFLYVEGATRPSGALAAMKPPAGVIGVEGLEVQRVAEADASTGELRQITPANLHVYEFDWSADSGKLAYVAAPPPGENNWWVAKLYTQPVDSAQPKVLFDPDTTPGPLHGLQIAVPRWSPDGSRIAFIGGLMSDQGATGGDLYAIGADGSAAPVDLTPGSSKTISWITWTPQQHIIASEVDGGSVRVADYPMSASGASAGRTLFTRAASVGDGRLELSLSFDRTFDRVAFVSSSYESAPEVYTGPVSGSLAAITHYNDALKPSWGKSESVEWTNEGFHVQGWLIYPADYDPAKKYPMIVMVHGGPSSAVLPRWPYAGYGGVPFASLGYFVLMPNPRGSYGQGEQFTMANRKDFGYGDLRDILAGVDAVEKNHPIDNHRLGLTGWSYGGFMTMFAVTQTHRFHAAVAGAGIANWKSYYGENSIDQWMVPFFGASVYDDPGVYAKSSAINFIHNVKTPTLVVVGDRDGECPAPQSFEFWHALRAEHVPTELVVYPNEGHGFVSPEHRRDVLERALGWFEQYMP